MVISLPRIVWNTEMALTFYYPTLFQVSASSGVTACERWVTLLHKASVLLLFVWNWHISLSFATIFLVEVTDVYKSISLLSLIFMNRFHYFWSWHVIWGGLGVAQPLFQACVHNCFSPPDGAALLLNENAGAHKSDNNHPSKTSTVPHPKFC